jgi:hypothetical protein
VGNALIVSDHDLEVRYLPSSTNVQCVTIHFYESECLYSISDNNSYEYITMGISSLNVVQCQGKRVAYYLSSTISTYLSATAVQNYMHLNPFQKVLVSQRVKKS